MNPSTVPFIGSSGWSVVLRMPVVSVEKAKHQVEIDRLEFTMLFDVRCMNVRDSSKDDLQLDLRSLRATQRPACLAVICHSR